LHDRAGKIATLQKQSFDKFPEKIEREALDRIGELYDINAQPPLRHVNS